MKNKNKSRIIKLFALGFLLISIVLIMEQSSVEANMPEGYYISYGGKQYNEYDIIDIKSNENTIISIRGKDTSWTPDAESTEWSSDNTKVLDITSGNTTPLTANLVPKGPGYSQVRVIFKTKENTTHILEFGVSVDFTIDKDQSKFNVELSNKDRLLNLETTDDVPKKTHPIVLARINKGAGKDTVGVPYTDSELGGLMNWTTADEKVVSVDEDGNVTAEGAGKTTVTVETRTDYDGKRLKDEFVTIVTPTFKLEYPGMEDGPYDSIRQPANSPNYVGDPDDPNPKEVGSPSFTIKSNSENATNLVWKVVDKNNREVTEDNMYYEINEYNGSVEFYNVKAGTYTIFAYAKDRQNNNDAINYVPYAALKINVPVMVESGDIVMNVGDSYNMRNSVNAPISGDYIYSIGPGNENYLDISDINITGEIVALRKGKVAITMTDPDGKEHTLNVRMIDGISLSLTNATMFAPGTLKLVATVSDPAARITWSSSDKDIATVNQNGVVTAIKAGKVKITASVTIDGVVKRATSNITVIESINSINITPRRANLGVGEQRNLVATVTPHLNSVDLIWKSSDESIVKIVEAEGFNAIIEGVSGGFAVITAVNRDNIVMGHAQITVTEPVTKIELSETSLSISLSLKKIQLRATVLPENATNKNIIWSSTDESVAKVDKNGLVTLLKPGTTSIIAMSEDNNRITAICHLYVQVDASGIKLDKNELELRVGGENRLTYLISPANATNKDVTWTSTDPRVASVDATGKVTGRGVGKTIIMVKTVEGGWIDYCTVTVKREAGGIIFDTSDLNLKRGQEHYIKATILPADTTERIIIWSSSDPKVATVDSAGKVTAVGAGKAIIMGRTLSGELAFCNVTVSVGAESVSIRPRELTINKGQTRDLEAVILPLDTSNKKVTWESSNTKVATVDKNGVVKALRGGVTLITVRTDDGNHAGTCVLSVTELATTVKLNYSGYKLGFKKNFSLKATVKSPNTSNPTVRWVSSNPRVATVNKNGRVTAKSLGYTTIRAIARDGSQAEDDCLVRVVREVTSISVNETYLSMLVGNSKKIKATIRPSNATYKSAKWSSSDNKVAVVDSSGKVTAIAPGNATITAAANDRSGRKATTYVQVRERVPATSLTVMDRSIIMVRGEKTSVQVAVSPANSTDGYTWSTNNSAVASVGKKSGQITAKATGTAIISVMSDSGAKSTVEVTVVGLNRTSVTLQQYEGGTRLSVLGSNLSIFWHSENDRIATVSATGEIIPRATGTTNVIATVNGRRLVCRVRVIKNR